MNHTNAEQFLRSLSKALDLPYEAQDWGIVNANAGRLHEFIGFYKANHENLQPTQRFELGGLILASANARLLENPGEDTRLLQEFIGSHREEFAAEAEYWQNLMDLEQFPLGVLLRLWGSRGAVAR